MFTGNEDIGALVADVGSFATRIGYAGDDMPRAYFPTSVGTFVDDTSSGIAKRSCTFDIANFKENLAIESPIKDGIITDWDLMERIWEHAITRYLKVDSKESPVLIAEKPYNPPSSRQRSAEMMFEKFHSPAIFFSKDAVLECYACGRTTGLAIDIGASGTIFSPVIDGYVETKGMNRSIVGGRVMDSFCLAMIKKYANNSSSSRTAALPHFRVTKSVALDRSLVAAPSNVTNVSPSYDAFMRLEMARDLKETVIRIADAPWQDADPKYANLPMTAYELPDGTIVDVGVDRFNMSELLFDPSSLELDCSDMALVGFTAAAAAFAPKNKGAGAGVEAGTGAGAGGADPNALPQTVNDSLARLVSNSILRCDTEVQSNLLANLVVAGGGAAVEGLPERVKLDVETLVHAQAPSLRIKSIALGAGERALTAWLGGSILASLGSFHEMWLSRQEYDEIGPGLIDKKCP